MFDIKKNIKMNELPELISRKIWKYKLQQTFKKIKSKQHKLIKKHTRFDILDELEIKFNNNNINNINIINAYACNYNILRIMSGMGSLAYQN